MFVFSNPCARAELHQRKRARKLCSATLSQPNTQTQSQALALESTWDRGCQTRLNNEHER